MENSSAHRLNSPSSHQTSVPLGGKPGGPLSSPTGGSAIAAAQPPTPHGRPHLPTHQQAYGQPPVHHQPHPLGHGSSSGGPHHPAALSQQSAHLGQGHSGQGHAAQSQALQAHAAQAHAAQGHTTQAHAAQTHLGQGGFGTGGFGPGSLGQSGLSQGGSGLGGSAQGGGPGQAGYGAGGLLTGAATAGSAGASGGASGPGVLTAPRKLSGRRRRETVAVLIFGGAPIFESSIPLSVFGVDRQDAGVPRYRLLVCAGEDGPLATTGGLTLSAPYGLEALARAGTIVVPAWRSISQPPPVEAIAALRKAHHEGARIIGLCTGAFVLAAAGLLDGRPATTHWMYAPTLAKRYPRVHVDPRELFVDDGDVLTSAGTAAGIDLCLHVVRSDHGAEAANALARRLVVPSRRGGGGQAQYIDQSLPEEIGNDPLAEVVTWALENLNQQFDVEVLAARAYMSRRTFDRRFRTLTGSAPLQWLITQRVLQAQRLLETSELSVDDVARRCGFRSPVALRGHFRRQLGVSPATYRTSYRARRPVPSAAVPAQALSGERQAGLVGAVGAGLGLSGAAASAGGAGLPGSGGPGVGAAGQGGVVSGAVGPAGAKGQGGQGRGRALVPPQSGPGARRRGPESEGRPPAGQHSAGQQHATGHPAGHQVSGHQSASPVGAGPFGDGHPGGEHPTGGHPGQLGAPYAGSGHPGVGRGLGAGTGPGSGPTAGRVGEQSGEPVERQAGEQQAVEHAVAEEEGHGQPTARDLGQGHRADGAVQSGGRSGAGSTGAAGATERPADDGRELSGTRDRAVG
ncbi:AraC family transcriptional regulator [Kitasatospora sp. MMS16-BH015]|nr:AraC family transcriptional regulator [Kitasatospora sp. MMS16-BH015]